MRRGPVRPGPAAVCVLFLASLAGKAPADPDCHPAHIDQRSGVQYVVDGDTIILGDGEHLRFIGIDTPEIGHHGAPSQPYAEEARRFLEKMLARDAQVELVFDTQRHDHFGRLLAHVFLQDGASVEARILEAGYAVPFTWPPDTGYMACYREAAAEARAAVRGLWSLPDYQPREVSALDPDTHGYRVVTGEVTHVGRSRRAVWLDFGRTFAVQIPREDLAYFKDVDLDGMRGRHLQAQGMVYAAGGQLRMRIRHPVDLLPWPEKR